LASLVGAFVLVSLSVEQGEVWYVVSASIYGVTLVALYAASTLYHALKGTRARNALRVLDHCAIYLLIAGTYTPVTLVSMRGGWGWTLFGLAWGFAAVGIVFKISAADRYAVFSTVAYVLMGWLCIIAVKPMFVLLSPGALALLGAGGLSLHRRNILLPLGPRPVLPRCLAPLRRRRERLPLPRRCPVRARPECVGRSAAARGGRVGCAFCISGDWF
jgi:hemolysin III